jgi:phosphate:Na+ symporter
VTDAAFQLLGGLGLFLIGMVLLTDGLKSFAGNALRATLLKFTGTPLAAFFSGALVTLAAQSSSATTVTVIGFVSAGLLSFPQALGVVIGASVGTTGTGWLVATLGLKISLGYYALPLAGVGGLLKLLGPGRKAALGMALAGFSLIFMGIDTLQAAMAGVAGAFNLAALPSGGLGGHALAMLLGAALTVVTQSSSAAMATILAALHGGAVNFEQAASLAIGAAIGTTITGAIAALGGTVSAKRTALAHVIFNTVTGLIAMLLLPWFLKLVFWAQDRLGLDPGAMSLAAFHTVFVLFGAALFLPFVNGFARLISRLLPERGPRLTRHLDASLVNTPPVAVEASLRALRETAVVVFEGARDAMAGGTAGAGAQRADRIEETRAALDAIQDFLSKMPAPPDEGPAGLPGRVSQVHAIDHLTRLLARLDPTAPAWNRLRDKRLDEPRRLALSVVESAREWMAGGQPPEGGLEGIEANSAALAGLRRELRPKILQHTSDGGVTPAESLELLDSLHWMDHASYHSWRICHYLGATPDG